MRNSWIYRNGSRWVGGYFPGLWTSRQRIHYKALPTAGGCLPFLFCAPQGPHLVAHLPNMGVVDEIFMTSGLCMFGDSSMRLEPNRMFGSKSVDYARHKFKGGLSKWDHPSGPAQLSSARGLNIRCKYETSDLLAFMIHWDLACSYAGAGMVLLHPSEIVRRRMFVFCPPASEQLVVPVTDLSLWCNLGLSCQGRRIKSLRTEAIHKSRRAALTWIDRRYKIVPKVQH